MTETACFLITKRSDLIDMTKRLIGAIESGFFENREDPLLVSLTGNFRSGKSLVADMTPAIIGHNFQMREDEFWGRRWKGNLHSGQPVEVAFMNFYLWRILDYDRFFQAREIGGINFAQNAPQLSNEADIAICIERPIKKPQNYYRLQHSRFKNLPDVFSDRSPARSAMSELPNHYDRFVSIRVNNKKLLNAPVFREAFDAFNPRQGTIMVIPTGFVIDHFRHAVRRAFGYEEKIQPLKTISPLPVYNQDFPKAGPG